MKERSKHSRSIVFTITTAIVTVVFVLLIGNAIFQTINFDRGDKAANYFSETELEEYLGSGTIREILQRHWESPLAINGVIDPVTNKAYVEVIFSEREYRLSGPQDQMQQFAFYKAYTDAAADGDGDVFDMYYAGVPIEESEYDFTLNIVNYNVAAKDGIGPRGIQVGDPESSVIAAFPDLSEKYKNEKFTAESGITKRFYGIDDMKPSFFRKNHKFFLVGGLYSGGISGQGVVQYSFLRKTEAGNEYGYVFYMTRSGVVQSIASGYYQETTVVSGS